MEEVDRGDSESAVVGFEETFWGEDIYSEHL